MRVGILEKIAIFPISTIFLSVNYNEFHILPKYFFFANLRCTLFVHAKYSLIS